MKDYIVTEFNYTGICQISIPDAIKQWDKSCRISQWHDKYTLLSKELKIQISKQAAHELIALLDLIQYKSDVFRNGSTWRKKEHMQ